MTLRTDERPRETIRDETVRAELEQARALLDTYIADRETTERALRESEDRYRSLFERAAFGIYRATPEGQFLEANPALIRMLGYDSLEELQALEIGPDVYVEPERRAKLYREAAHHDPPDPWVEVEWKRKDGSRLTVRLSARLVRDATGRIIYCESIAEDVTDRRRKEELMRRHERLAALGTTLAGVAHELNNPLAAIKGFAQLMLRKPSAVDEQNALETIHRETERAAKIVRDLLTFARRQETHQREIVDLSRVVGYILATRRYAMETRGISCRADLVDGLPTVLADSAQLEQVVLNLVLNAEQALAPLCDAPPSPTEPLRHDARIVVRTTADDISVILVVEDNGPGVAQADLPRIWDPFFTTKPEGEGTGLGLSVVHGIVSSHGGTVEAESTPGQGMRVIVRLPTADDAAAAVADELAHPRELESEATRTPTARVPLDILLVDDETSILAFLKEFLESRGHAVLTALDGDLALRLAELARFDVVMCDLRMPGLGGDEVIQRLRRLGDFQRTRFIVSTGDNASGSAAARIAALQPDAVLRKPYDMEHLRRVVESNRTPRHAR